MYTLYTIPGTCSTGITALLEKLNVEYKTVTRDETPNYSEIVPTNQVPALVTDGQVITEGAAIALYLLEKHENDMLPKDLSKKGEFLQWLMFNYATLHPAYSKILTVGKCMESSEEKTKLKQKLADNLSGTWQIIDKQLATNKYMMGDEPSVMDYLLTIYTSWEHYMPDVKITLGANVRRLVQDVTALPEFQAAYQSENTEFRAAA